MTSREPILLQDVDDFCRLAQLRLVHGEGKVGEGGVGVSLMFCTIMSTLMLASAMALKICAATPGRSGTPTSVIFGLVFVERDAANDDVFHAAGFFFHNSSWVVVETGADFENDAEFFGEFHRAGLHDLGAQAGQFQHFVVGDFRQLARARHDARIGRVNAIDIRINLAEIGLERGGQGDGRQVRTAPTQCGDLAVAASALEIRRR